MHPQKPFMPQKRFKTTASSIQGERFAINMYEKRGFFGNRAQWSMPVGIIATMIFAFFLSFWLGSCTPKATDSATLKANSAKHQKTLYAVLPDEKALLSIRLAMILHRVKNQEHTSLFDTWMPIQQQLDPVLREQFLNMMYCADRFLGPMKAYNTADILVLQDKNDKTFIINVVSSREQAAEVEEQLRFVQDNLDYTLIGYYIKSSNDTFHDCVRRISYPDKAVVIKK